jgi:threonine/homoserine/homoserine lactone efflux protein
MNAMFHRHLDAAYAVTWIIQLGYLSYAGWKCVTARKAQHAAGQSNQMIDDNGKGTPYPGAAKLT